MPFTLSHPAAVLPMLSRGRARGPLIASALVAGSMAPDVPYFANSLIPGAFGYGTVTHSLPGIPTVDVLIAASLVAGWHGLLREPLVALLPERWATGMEALTAPGTRAARRRVADGGWFLLSAALGAATHIGCDAFTHHDRAGVRLLPVLNRTVAGQPGYHLLQYGASALALVWLGRYAVQETRRAATQQEQDQDQDQDQEGPESKANAHVRAQVQGTSPGGRPVRLAPPADRASFGPAVRPARLRLSVRARAAALALIGAAAAVGAGERVSHWLQGAPQDVSLGELVPVLAFGAGTGAVLGTALYAAAVKAAQLGSRR
jgi:hypothetical protein